MEKQKKQGRSREAAPEKKQKKAATPFVPLLFVASHIPTGAFPHFCIRIYTAMH